MPARTAKPKTESPNGEVKARTVRPFKLVCNLIVAVRDEKGEVVAEIDAARLMFYLPDFGAIEQTVLEDAMPEIERAYAEGRLQGA